MQIPVKSNYWEIHQPLPGNLLAIIGNPLAPTGKLPTIGKLTIEVNDFQVVADGFAGSWNFTDICISFVPIIIYSA